MSKHSRERKWAEKNARFDAVVRQDEPMWDESQHARDQNGKFAAAVGALTAAKNGEKHPGMKKVWHHLTMAAEIGKQVGAPAPKGLAEALSALASHATSVYKGPGGQKALAEQGLDPDEY